MTSISKIVFVDKLAYIVDKYNQTYCSTIKMKLLDVRSSTYTDFDKKKNKEDPKVKVGDHVRISKYKNILAKSYVRNWSEEVFMKFKNTVPWTYVISDFKGEEIVVMFYEKELQKPNQKEFRIEKVIKRKVINYMSNRKFMIIHLIVGLIKKICLYKNELLSTL